MQLIYRAASYKLSNRSAQSARQPKAINWRYQVADKAYNTSSKSMPVYRQPKAINWRFDAVMQNSQLAF